MDIGKQSSCLTVTTGERVGWKANRSASGYEVSVTDEVSATDTEKIATPGVVANGGHHDEMDG